MAKSAIKWRAKHEPAKTMYTIQCHDTLTLTYPPGNSIHPKDADFVAKAAGIDVPEHWALWGHVQNWGWEQSRHDTKEDARPRYGRTD